MKISVDNLSLPSFSTGNGSTLVKTIEIGYGYSRIYAGIVLILCTKMVKSEFNDKYYIKLLAVS